MLYLHNLHNVDRISTYIIKLHGQATSSLYVETQERCSNLNGEYTGKPIEECALDLNMDLTTTRVIHELQKLKWIPI